MSEYPHTSPGVMRWVGCCSAGYLEGELEKLNITIVPGGNVEAPDPQDMIDLEVNYCSRTCVFVCVCVVQPMLHTAE